MTLSSGLERDMDPNSLSTMNSVPGSVLQRLSTAQERTVLRAPGTVLPCLSTAHVCSTAHRISKKPIVPDIICNLGRNCAWILSVLTASSFGFLRSHNVGFGIPHADRGFWYSAF